MLKTKTKYRIKLSDPLLMVCINVLNEKRKCLKSAGRDTSELNRILLKLLDVCEA